MVRSLFYSKVTKERINMLAEIKTSLHKANCWGVFGLTSRHKLITVLDLCTVPSSSV